MWVTAPRLESVPLEPAWQRKVKAWQLRVSGPLREDHHGYRSPCCNQGDSPQPLGCDKEGVAS